MLAVNEEEVIEREEESIEREEEEKRELEERETREPEVTGGDGGTMEEKGMRTGWPRTGKVMVWCAS